MTTYLGKSFSFGFPRVPFVNCRQFMYLVISLLVLRAGCGIWLFQFLIIACLFTKQARHFHVCSEQSLYSIVWMLICPFCLFVCQTASISYSLAFQILWPELFFPQSWSIKGMSSYATHSTIFTEKNQNYFSQMLQTAKIKISEK